MALPTFVAVSTVVATSTTAVCTYPAGFAANDLLVMLVSSDSASINTPSGWTKSGATSTGGGTSVAVFKKTAAGSETGSVTATITGGTKGIATMAAYRPAAGVSADIKAISGGIDNDNASTAISITGSPLTTATDDLLSVFTLISANGGAFTGNATSPVLSMSAGTVGTQTARATGRASTNTLFYALRDEPVTTGGTGNPAYTATGAGANASGAGIFFAVRTVPFQTAPNASATVPASARIDETYTITDTSTATTSGATITGRVWRIISGGGTLSSTTASSVTVTAPPLPGTQVLGLIATDSNGLPSTEHTYSITINAGPVPNAGPDQLTKEALSTVALAGSGTSGATAYSWRQVSGQVVTLSSATAQNPTFRAPASVDGLDLVFALSVAVNSSSPFSAEDTVKIHIRPHIEWYVSGSIWKPMTSSKIT